MQTIKFNSDQSNIEAVLQEAGDDLRLLTVKAVNKEGAILQESIHTVVFEHAPECDEIEEVKDYAERVLHRSS